MENSDLSAEDFLKKVRELKEKSAIALISGEAEEMHKANYEIDCFFKANRHRILDNLDDAYQAFLDGKIY